MDTPEQQMEMYRDAVRQNIGNKILIPMPEQVHVQIMPALHRHGHIFLAKKPKELGTTRLWCRFGTVITTGSAVDIVKPGDIVFFSNMLGVRFLGYSNPLKLEINGHTEDEFRIFKVTPRYSEIWGKWHPDLIGKTVMCRLPSSSNEVEVEVMDECPSYGAYFKGRPVGTTEDKWMPYSWLVDGHAKNRSKS
jgi:hypothetical protein